MCSNTNVIYDFSSTENTSLTRVVAASLGCSNRQTTKYVPSPNAETQIRSSTRLLSSQYLTCRFCSATLQFSAFLFTRTLLSSITRSTTSHYHTKHKHNQKQDQKIKKSITNQSLNILVHASVESENDISRCTASRLCPAKKMLGSKTVTGSVHSCYCQLNIKSNADEHEMR